MRPFTTAVVGMTIFCLCIVSPLAAQKRKPNNPNATPGTRTTGPDPLDLTLVQTPAGIELYRGDVLTPRTPLGPKTPLEIMRDDGLADIHLSFGSDRQLCTNPGVCMVTVRYQLGTRKSALYLVRAAGKLLVVSPDDFVKVDKSKAVLRHAKILQVQESDMAAIEADENASIVASFGKAQ